MTHLTLRVGDELKILKPHEELFIQYNSESPPFRIQALLQWVHDSSRVAAHKMSSPMGYTGAAAVPSSSSSREYGLLMPSPSHLHCVAAILWHSYELPVDYDLPALLNRELFESVNTLSLIINTAL